MFTHPYLALVALTGAILGSSVAAAAQSQSYPLPSAPAAGQAQDPAAAPAPRRKNRMRAALQQLDLSSDQRAKIVSLMKSFRASRSSAQPMTRKELRSNIEAVLTADQRTKFEGLMRRRRVQPVPAAT